MVLCLLAVVASSGLAEPGEEDGSVADERKSRRISDALEEDDIHFVLETSVKQPQPLVRPTLEAQPETALPAEGLRVSVDIFGANRIAVGTLSDDRRATASKPSADLIFGSESKIRVSTDSGNLIGKSPSALGAGIQRRTPIVTDPRIRGARVGSLAASGSYWVPARIDLDTMMSKIDSRIVSDIIVVNGPFSVQYGPGLSFVDVELLRSPRYEDGFESHGSTAVDYKLNGQQVYGRQEFWGGSDNYGFRVGYGHGTGNDYRSGSGVDIAASYNSRDFDVAIGRDLSDDSYIEFSDRRLRSRIRSTGSAVLRSLRR